MGNITRKPGDGLGNWILREHLGGGNGNVWRVSRAAGVGEDRALKLAESLGGEL